MKSTSLPGENTTNGIVKWSTIEQIQFPGILEPSGQQEHYRSILPLFRANLTKPKHGVTAGVDGFCKQTFILPTIQRAKSPIGCCMFDQ